MPGDSPDPLLWQLALAPFLGPVATGGLLRRLSHCATAKIDHTRKTFAQALKKNGLVPICFCDHTLLAHFPHNPNSMNCSMHHMSAPASHTMGCQRGFVCLQAVASWQINQVTTTKRAAGAYGKWKN